MSLFRTKDLEAMLAHTRDEEKGLKRTLTAWSLIALGIGAIIGAGLFVDNEVGAATARKMFGFARRRQPVALTPRPSPRRGARGAVIKRAPRLTHLNLDSEQ